MKKLITKVIKWHEDRNLIEGSTDKDQVLKLQQELGELSDSVCKQKDVRDDLGDMMVIMLNIMKRNDITMEECLETAYNDIKDRKGKMVDGVFIKEKDDIEKKLKEFKNKIKTKCEVISVFSNKDIQKVKKLLIKNVN